MSSIAAFLTLTPPLSRKREREHHRQMRCQAQ